MNSNRERANNHNGVDNHWDSLSDIPFNTGGGYKTESGIFLTGGAGQAMAEKSMGVVRPTAEAQPQPVAETRPAAQPKPAEAVAAPRVEAPVAQSVEQLQPGAADDFINKINNAASDKEIEEAVKLGYEITSGVNVLSTEEKQKAQDFMASPIFRKRQLQNDIAINEKRLSGMEDTIRRSEEEYKQVRKGGLIARFTNRFRIKESKERVARARKIHENAISDIARWREELARLDSDSEEAA